MTTEVTPNDWASIDTWWDPYENPTLIATSLDSAQVGQTDQFQDYWNHLDEWHGSLDEKTPVAHDCIASGGIGETKLADSWSDLDPWWREYITTGHETTEHIADMLVQSNEAWKNGPGPFDSDPLHADVTGKYDERGPLRPTGEVAWSRWLARLLQPSQAFVSELFDVSVNEPPQEVIRENRLETENDDVAYRRPDILLCHPEQGISIEVKLDDPNYSKTAETAKLVEQQYDGKWTHTLLLPQRHASRLDATVEPGLTDRADGHPQIEWDDPGAIEVLYWRDVSAALRTLLRRGDIVDDHWAANAYLFCSVVEQQLLGFSHQEEIEQMAEPSDIIDTTQPIALADTLEEQLTYLREMNNT